MSEIVEVVGHYLELKENGKEYKCNCPFHSERSPSFTVVPEGNFFYCFGCGESGDAIEFVKKHEKLSFHEAKAKVLEILGIDSEEFENKRKEGTDKPKKEKPKPLDPSFVKAFIGNVGYKSNGYRGIRDDVNKFFGHLTKLDSNGNVLARYYPETYEGKVTGYKCRNHPKDFSHGKIGTTGIVNELSGQVKFNSGGKYVLLVGGEEDVCAAFQMLSDRAGDGFSGIPVVSPTSGENSAVKQCAAQYEWFDSFDNIIIGLDNDKAGLKAALEVAEVLPKEKVRIAKWSGKDPNQMLIDGMQNQFVRDFYNAKPFVETGIKTSLDALSTVNSFLTADKILFPPHLHKLNTNTRGGIRSTGAVVNIIGDTSIGKSFFSDTLFYYWIFNSPIKPTVVSLERTAEEVSIDLLSLHLKKNLMWFTDGHDAVSYKDHPDVVPLWKNLFEDDHGEPRFYIIDERDGDVGALKKQMEKSAKMNGSNLFIIDPLTDFLRSLGLDQQEDFMLWEKFQKKQGMIFLNILHTRKPPTDKEGKVRKVTEYDVLGSGTFVQSADINIVLNRDKMNEDPLVRNTTEIDMPKCRGGITGKVGDYVYDAETRQQYDLDDYLAKIYEQQGASFNDKPLPEPPKQEEPPLGAYEEDFEELDL